MVIVGRHFTFRHSGNCLILIASLSILLCKNSTRTIILMFFKFIMCFFVIACCGRDKFAPLIFKALACSSRRALIPLFVYHTIISNYHMKFHKAFGYRLEFVLCTGNKFSFLYANTLQISDVR